MKPSRFVWERLSSLLAHDVNSLRNPTNPELRFRVITAPFTPTPDLKLADLTMDSPSIADEGLLLAGSTACNDGFTPAPIEPMIYVYPTFTGFFIRADVTSDPVTVYGLALVGSGGTQLYGTWRFENPLMFSRADQLKFFSNQIFAFPYAMFS